MKRTMHRAIGSLALTLVLAISSAASAEDRVDAREQPPDVVVILVDDLGWHDVGFTGGRSHATPNVDGFAADATVFSNGYSDGPNCAPTRASLLTGLATPRHGLITVNSSKRGKAENRLLEPVPNKMTLDPATPTLPGILRDDGWRTVHVGKFHVGPDPLQYGFTDAIAGGSQGHPRSYTSPFQNPALVDGPEGEYLTDRLVSEAVTILEEKDERPLFLYMSFYTVHTPIQPRADLLEAARARNPEASARAHKYDAMVACMDEAVGRILAAIDRRQRPCLVVFASDNGGLGGVADNGPLRGSKGMLYEGGIRVPLAVRWPQDGAPALARVPVLLRDLAPTILEVTGHAEQATDMDGRSFAAIMDAGSLEARPLHWHFPAYLARAGKQADPWRTTPAAAVRDGSWKLVEFFEDGRTELYDLERDPSEQVNVASGNEATVDRLRTEMLRWRKHVGAAMPTPVEAQPEAVEEPLKGGS